MSGSCCCSCSCCDAVSALAFAPALAVDAALAPTLALTPFLALAPTLAAFVVRALARLPRLLLLWLLSCSYSLLLLNPLIQDWFFNGGNEFRGCYPKVAWILWKCSINGDGIITSTLHAAELVAGSTRACTASVHSIVRPMKPNGTNT